MNTKQFTLGLVATLGLIGCGGTAGSGLTNLTRPRIRAINGFNGIGTAGASVRSTSSGDIIQTIATEAAYAVPTLDAIVDDRGDLNIVFSPSNSSGTLATSTKNFTYGDHITAIGYGTSGSRKILALNDNNDAGDGGTVGIRLIHAADSVGGLDVYVTAPGAALSNDSKLALPASGSLYPSQNPSDASYSNLAINGNSQTFEVRVFRAGTTSGALYDQQMTFTSKTRYSFAVLDPVGSSTTPVIILLQDNFRL